MSLHVDRRNTAVRRFRQGLARGLRTPEAVCTLHLLDRRFDRAEFVNALPTRFAPAYRARFGTVELRTNQTEGILLRRDLHALMDAGKLEIVDGVVAIVGTVASAHYQEFNGVKVW